ncbi:TIM-barrel domain-containing protein [Geofilum rhodophaeum]|uniref:TIM-barrel domain-containing protein n=1 Tax=Geofilum rhodophaeum TaxID=1965019 RepID=UPI00197AE770|nr:TIM-barrel domain-containing protein [Geofilum rhodophaeum]
MMKRFFAYGLMVASIFWTSCEDGNYQSTETGLEVKSANGDVVRLDVVADEIIQVRTSPTGNFSDQASLIAIKSADGSVDFSIEEDQAGKVILKTAAVQAEVDLNGGAVRFLDADGKTVLQEQTEGRSFKPVTVDGVEGYELRQVWASPDDEEAIYGLGQHQAHEMNYKGRNEELFQYNTKVSVPFIVSTGNYGVLWDNYSLSRYGDPRPYGQMDQFKLYNAEGEEGSLTATYVDDVDTEHVFTVRNESTIDYENLETIQNFPEGFNFNHSRITWEGQIEAGESGLHHFLMYYAGYTKIWINGELMAERWRTAWNPSVAKFQVEMTAGEKVDLKLEWFPDGGESYIGLKALSPVDPQAQNQLAFFSEMGDEINYYFIKGDNLDEVISGYRELTGKAQVMPKWAMGFWQSRERYKTQDELLDVLKEFRRRQIPIDNIVQDWSFWEEDQWGSQKFDLQRFPDPKGMIQEVHDNNARIMISVWPKFYTNTEHYKQFDEKGWMYQQAVKDSVRDWIADGYMGSFYDAYNPGARELFWDQIRDNLYDLGIDAWWLDATEPDILSNASIAYRKALMNPTYYGPATKYFNAYALMNAKGIYEGQRDYNPDERVFILTRSGFAGMQRYGTVTWSGDVGTVWEDLRAQITAGVNFSMSGMPYWTMDIGGFCVEKRYETAREGSEDMKEWRELNTRWYQFGAFVPLFRVHGQYPFREIWNIAPEGHPAYSSMLFYNKLRYRLMPYIYSLTGAVYHKDYTIMRALAMDYAHDKSVYDINDQYLFGSAFMVCPVGEYGATEREVYFPAGKGWYDFNTGAFHQGGSTKVVAAPYERMPLFVPEGSVIPFGPEIEHTAQQSDEPYTIMVFTGKDGSFEWYEDEATNYNYEEGAFSSIVLNWNEAAQTLTLGQRSGSFEGMAEKKSVRVIFIDQDNGTPFELAVLNRGKVYEYDGSELQIAR